MGFETIDLAAGRKIDRLMSTDTRKSQSSRVSLDSQGLLEVLVI